MRYLVGVAVAVSLLVVAGAAGAAEGDPFLKACWSNPSLAPCAQLTPGFRATDAELSADGKHLYVAVWSNGDGFNGVRVFDVGAGGAIAPKPEANVSTGLEQGLDIDVAPDGRTVYLAAGPQLFVYNRDPASGALAQAQAVPGISFTGLAVSPDGRNVYARGSNRLTIFDRDASGALTQKLMNGCFTEDFLVGCGDAAGIGGDSTDAVVSADGLQLYVSNQAPGGVAIFQRAADGTLTQAGCVTADGTSGSGPEIECAVGSPTLGQARAANSDPQSTFVLVSGDTGNTIYRRTTSTGALAQTDCLDELGGPGPAAGCHEIRGAAGGDAAITPDLTGVVLNAGGFGLAFLTLDQATGKLSQRGAHGCFTALQPSAPCDYAAGLMGGLGSVAISPDNLHVFAAMRGGSGGAIASIERDSAPSCANSAVTVRKRAALYVPLACTDANGDDVTLEIADPPVWGTLGPIDQAKDRLRYTPDPRHKGKDTFRFLGRARGTVGATATVTMNVVAAPVFVDRKAPNTRITAGPQGSTRKRTAKFKFGSTEKGSSFQCKLDRTSWQRCKSGKTYRLVRVGKHTFRVRAMDRAGNIDGTPAKRTWKRTR